MTSGITAANRNFFANFCNKSETFNFNDLAEHWLRAHDIDMEDEIDLRIEREKYLQSSLSAKPKRKETSRKSTSSDEDSSSLETERKNKPYRDTAWKRGITKVANKAENISSSFETFKKDATAKG